MSRSLISSENDIILSTTTESVLYIEQPTLYMNYNILNEQWNGSTNIK